MSSRKKSEHATILGRRGGLGRYTLAPPTKEEIYAASMLGKKGGIKGGKNRASILSTEKRIEIATWASLIAKLGRSPASMTEEDMKEYERLKKLGYKTKEERQKSY